MPSEESQAERLDREHEQLFHELRSILPGAEVLFAFLLTIAFTERFKSLTVTQRNVYFATFLIAGAALVLLLAPTAFHRIRFRQGDKEAMLRLANVEMIAAMTLMSVAITGVVFLICDVLFRSSVALLVCVPLLTFISTLWWAVPLRRKFNGTE
jgi:CDP-diglyceride synthetase